jgi:hypothetical protein
MVLCGNGHAVKATVEISDDLYRRAKAEAALRERHARFLAEPRSARWQASLFSY